MSDNLEARRLVQGTINAKTAQLEQYKKERAATWRRHQRLGEILTALDSELKGLAGALDELGGPLPKDEPDEEAAE